MALVYPNEKSPSNRSWGTVNLSTNADGVTGSDVLDCGGLTLSAIALNTLASTACTYSFKGSLDTTANMQTILSSSGALLMYGSTTVSPQNAMIIFDPSPFAGVRMVQLVSNTTSAAAPNATGATAKLGLSAFAPQK